MKIKNTLCLAMIVYSLVLIAHSNAQAEDSIALGKTEGQSHEEKIKKNIDILTMEVFNSKQKLMRKKEDVRLVQNHINVTANRINSFKSELGEDDFANKCSKYPHKIGGSAEQDKYLLYAYNLDSCERGFVKMIVAENGSINPTTQSKFITKRGVREDSWGFCQILKTHNGRKTYNSYIVEDDRFFSDWVWQMDKCFELYEAGVTFYGAFKPERADRQLEWRDA